MNGMVTGSRTRGHFSCLRLENILQMILLPFFTPSCKVVTAIAAEVKPIAKIKYDKYGWKNGWADK